MYICICICICSICVYVSCSVVSDSATPWTVDCQGSSVHGILHARISGYVTEDLADPGVEPGSPALQVDFLPSEPPGKPYIYIYIC